MFSRTLWSSLVLALLVTPAEAALPDPAHCIVENVIVGDSNGMQIGNGFRVMVFDAANNPVVNSHVVLAFNGSARPYTSQVPPAVASCPNIFGMTDAAGTVVFAPRIGGYDNNPLVEVRADGIFLRIVRSRSTDLTADGVTGAFDFVHFRNNFLNSPSASETDYNEDGITDPFDFNIFRMVFLNDIPGTPCP
jgi:hypothetical protein